MKYGSGNDYLSHQLRICKSQEWEISITTIYKENYCYKLELLVACTMYMYLKNWIVKQIEYYLWDMMMGSRYRWYTYLMKG